MFLMFVSPMGTFCRYLSGEIVKVRQRQNSSTQVLIFELEVWVCFM